MFETVFSMARERENCSGKFEQEKEFHCTLIEVKPINVVSTKVSRLSGPKKMERA